MAAPLGNQNSAKGRLWEGAIKRALARRVEGDLSRGLDILADKLVLAAESGDQWALLEIGNRLDGKPAQAVTVSGDEDNPIEHNHTVKFIGDR